MLKTRSKRLLRAFRPEGDFAYLIPKRIRRNGAVHPQRPPDVGWLHQVGERVLTWWPAKMTGTTLGMTVFFIVYFWLLRHPIHPLTTMPLTVVDRLVGFWPGAMLLYFSLWFYVSLAPALLIDRRELISYGMAAIGLSVIGLGIFLFWPAPLPDPVINCRRRDLHLPSPGQTASGSRRHPTASIPAGGSMTGTKNNMQLLSFRWQTPGLWASEVSS